MYKSDQTPRGPFPEQTRFILHTLAYHTQDIKGIASQKLMSIVGTMTQDSRQILLLYNQVRISCSLIEVSWLDLTSFLVAQCVVLSRVPFSNKY